MLVRVKETQVESFYGYYARTRLYPGDEFELVARKTASGETITAESQFSKIWMEKVNKPGPKPKAPVIPDPPLV
jgi:hypothetical protein